MKVASTNDHYANLLSVISDTFQTGQKAAIAAVNSQLVETYWKIGKYIVDFEQKGEQRAKYGSELLKKLSVDLSLELGKGFSLSNLKRMRQFFLSYPIGAEPPHQLSWSHWVELLKINDSLERSFYQQQAILEKWSTTELIRQKKASLFLRLSASKSKNEILCLANNGQIIASPKDVIRDPYILDFLNISENESWTEADLESKIIGKLQHFLLELGKGFAFIGRQYRITLGNRHFYVDLVFYHRILKCFVLIDLNREEASYEDIGQMNMYLGYFEKEENTEGDNQPIGIVLSKEKDELLVEYAMHNISSKLFVSKYQLYLPKREELQKLITEQEISFDNSYDQNN